MTQIKTCYTKLTAIEAPQTHDDFLPLRGKAAIFKNGITNPHALKLNFRTAGDLLPNEEVTLSLSLENDGLQAPCKLHDFLRYCKGEQDLTIQCFDKFSGEVEEKTFTTEPLYLFQRNCEHSEILKKFITGPEFLGDWFEKYMPVIQELIVYGDMHTWLFVGPKGTKSEMHIDHDNVHTTIQQLDGSKRFFLLSPKDYIKVSNALADRLKYVEFEIIDDQFCEAHTIQGEADLSVFNSVEIFSGDLNRHDLVYLPANWGHYAKSLEPSIGVSYDFIDDRNVDQYLFSGIFQSPTFTNARDSVPFYKVSQALRKYGL